MNRIKEKILSGGFTIITILLIAALLFPLLWVISSSLKPYAALYTIKFKIIPDNATLDAFRWVLFESKFLLWFKNSLIVYATTLIVSLLVIIPAGYAFSRFKFFVKESLLHGYFVLTQFMTGMSIVGLIALYTILIRIGMINSLIVLGFIYAASLVPFVTWYLKTYFDSVPRDFDEAALVDGASFTQNLRHVILPMAKPGIFTAIIFISIITWSEWIIGGIVLNAENYTVPIGLITLTRRWEVPWNHFAAMAIIYAIPIVLIFMLAQHYWRTGLTMGGLKG